MLPVLVEQRNGEFSATLAGTPSLSGGAPTRSGALAALQVEIQRRLETGELVTIELDRRGVSHLAGRFSDDPTLSEICEEAYADRDAERPA